MQFDIFKHKITSFTGIFQLSGDFWKDFRNHGCKFAVVTKQKIAKCGYFYP